MFGTAPTVPVGEQVGKGVAVVGCNATKDNGQIKLSIWPSAHVCAGGAQVESLTGFDASTVATEIFTATFTPGLDLAPLVAEGALPTCDVALGEAVAQGVPVAFQINRCMLEPPLEEYWTEERATKLRRLQSEPMTPPRRILDFSG